MLIADELSITVHLVFVKYGLCDICINIFLYNSPSKKLTEEEMRFILLSAELTCPLILQETNSIPWHPWKENGLYTLYGKILSVTL